MKNSDSWWFNEEAIWEKRVTAIIELIHNIEVNIIYILHICLALYNLKNIFYFILYFILYLGSIKTNFDSLKKGTSALELNYNHFGRNK